MTTKETSDLKWTTSEFYEGVWKDMSFYEKLEYAVNNDTTICEIEEHHYMLQRDNPYIKTEQGYECRNCHQILRTNKNLETHPLTSSCRNYRERADAWNEKTNNQRAFHSLLTPNLVIIRR